MKKEHKRTLLETMLAVAHFGLLRSNQEELEKMECFMRGLAYGKPGMWTIEDDEILYAPWEEDHYTSMYDITYYVLLCLYGNEEEKEEKFKAGFKFSIEDSCYEIDKELEQELKEVK